MMKKNNNRRVMLKITFVAVFIAAVASLFYLNAGSLSGYELALENQSADALLAQENTTDEIFETLVESNETSQQIATDETVTVMNETLADISNETSKEVKFTLTENETEIEMSQNETLEDLNITDYANETFENITISNETDTNLTEYINETTAEVNETFENETSEENTTANETQTEVNITENVTEILPAVRNLDLSIDVPSKMTRGHTYDMKATVTNIDSLAADNVTMQWELPGGFTIILGDQIHSCGKIQPGGVCQSVLSVKAELLTSLGSNSIRVLVDYD